MDVNVTNTQPGQNSAPSTAAGTAAPQTETQAAESKGQIVVKPGDSAQLENDAKNAEEKRFFNVKQSAAKFAAGDNSFLRDISFTVYNGGKTEQAEYEIRFTDISTGEISVRTEAELLGVDAGGNIVQGEV